MNKLRPSMVWSDRWNLNYIVVEMWHKLFRFFAVRTLLSVPLVKLLPLWVRRRWRLKSFLPILVFWLASLVKYISARSWLFNQRNIRSLFWRLYRFCWIQFHSLCRGFLPSQFSSVLSIRLYLDFWLFVWCLKGSVQFYSIEGRLERFFVSFLFCLPRHNPKGLILIIYYLMGYWYHANFRNFLWDFHNLWGWFLFLFRRTHLEEFQGKRLRRRRSILGRWRRFWLGW